MAKNYNEIIIDMFEHIISNYPKGITLADLNHTIWRFSGYTQDRLKQKFMLERIKHYLIFNGRIFTPNKINLEKDFGTNYHWSNLKKEK